MLEDLALFWLVFLAVPALMIWQLAWTVQHGRLPPLTMLSHVTRQQMPIAFWLYVAFSSFVLAVLLTFSATILVAALRARR